MSYLTATKPTVLKEGYCPICDKTTKLYVYDTDYSFNCPFCGHHIALRKVTKTMIDLNFVPETLEQCRQHYVPPVKKYISCEDFGHPDGMDGSCHWCLHMCPYQWEMCNDEAWVRGLLSPGARIPAKTREEVIEFIENYKQRHKE